MGEAWVYEVAIEPETVDLTSLLNCDACLAYHNYYHVYEGISNMFFAELLSNFLEDEFLLTTHATLSLSKGRHSGGQIAKSGIFRQKPPPSTSFVVSFNCLSWMSHSMLARRWAPTILRS